MSTVGNGILLAFCILALACGQMLFKIVSSRITSLIDVFSNPTTLALFATAAGLYASSTVAWVVVLKSIPLTTAYSFMALGFIIVPVAAHFLLGDPLSARALFGAVIIAFGVWLAVSG